MKDMLDKVFNMGIGALVMTKEKAENIVDELIKKGEMGQEEGRKLVNELLARGEKSRLELREEVRNMVRDALREAGVPEKYELEALKNEIQLLKESKPNEGELYQVRADIAQIRAKLNM